MQVDKQHDYSVGNTFNGGDDLRSGDPSSVNDETVSPTSDDEVAFSPLYPD